MPAFDAVVAEEQVFDGTEGGQRLEVGDSVPLEVEKAEVGQRRTQTSGGRGREAVVREVELSENRELRNELWHGGEAVPVHAAAPPVPPSALSSPPLPQAAPPAAR
eukprot:CAMPEP_0114629398 /NCGR_PEP_ID=MMETSP0168-20121206/13336_1 /TAXON_ID=95228 ORGANISM="Vannella sp., Strain DIVA3 517/6/12" /NCGR_SAMPLE_ID=MMETSP0168 /ASSEMBLY_ACC=CAM_ASM_000044 /LENGTH=105 /DNA_ID=CAMNT_0001840851 /DNA_START=37 /DNA_END=349 /DNA_ORIENTATION=+